MALTEEEIEKLEGEGFGAFLIKSACPYEKGSERYGHWKRGYDRAKAESDACTYRRTDS